MDSRKSNERFIELSNVIGKMFSDEIELEDYIKRSVKKEFRDSFNISVSRQKQGRDLSDLDFISEYVDIEPETLKKVEAAIAAFQEGKDYTSIIRLKELEFMDKINMTRDIAVTLDIPMRLKLEKIFPELKQFDILCFKQKTSTCRRALIHPKEYKYRMFMDTMTAFLNKYSLKYIPELSSRVKINFKGKYVLQIQEEIYRNFKKKIMDCIENLGLQSSVKPLIKRRELTIQGSYEKVDSIKKCVKEIMSFLYPKPVSFDKELAKNLQYLLTSRPGTDHICRLNNKFSCKSFGWFDHRVQRFFLRGDTESQTNYIRLLESWLHTYKSYLKKDYYVLPNPRIYFKRIREAKACASRYDIGIKYNEAEKRLDLIYSFCEDESLKVQKHKEKDIDKLKQYLDDHFRTYSDNSINYSDLKHDSFRNESFKDARCEICQEQIECRYRLLCEHSFCEICIKQFIIEHKKGDKLVCPDKDCQKCIVLVDIMALLTLEELRDHFLYQKHMFLVQKSRDFKQCPTPDCENILCSPETSQETASMDIFSRGVVFCDSCGNDFCFKCLRTHYDTDCSNSKLMMDEIPLELRPKNCPGCKILISKEAGCDFLTCPKCRIDFCFKCLKNFGSTQSLKEIYDHMYSAHGSLEIAEKETIEAEDEKPAFE